MTWPTKNFLPRGGIFCSQTLYFFGDLWYYRESNLKKRKGGWNNEKMAGWQGKTFLVFGGNNPGYISCFRAGCFTRGWG
jgi:hypothetical protein